MGKSEQQWSDQRLQKKEQNENRILRLPFLHFGYLHYIEVTCFAHHKANKEQKGKN